MDRRVNVRTRRRLAKLSVVNALIAAALILAFATLWTLVIPGLVAHHGGVFYRKDLLKRLPKDALTQLSSYSEDEAEDERKLAAIDLRLANAAMSGSTQDIPALLRYREEVMRASTARRPPIAALEFYLSPQLIMWTAIYSCLGWLLIIFRPAGHSLGRFLTKRSTWYLILLIYVLYEWPLWARNFWLGNDRRVVYGYPNFDVHPASFFMQELVVLGFCVLVALLWAQWAAYARYVNMRRPPAQVTDRYYTQLLAEVSAMFTEWQLRSLILTLGFVFFTNFYWTLVAQKHDLRYMLPAVQLHVVWVTSWGLLSLPIVIRWFQWANLRRRWQFRAATSDHKNEQLMTVLESARPIGGWGVSLSTVATTASLTAPIVQLFVR